MSRGSGPAAGGSLPKAGRGDAVFGALAVLIGILALIARLAGLFT